MKSKSVFVIIVFVLGFPFFCFTHGLQVEIWKKNPFLVLTSKYRNSLPIPAAAVKVFSPGGKTLYQEGKTDLKGRFIFIPDQEGDWYFQVDDGMGHLKKIKIQVEAFFFKESTDTAANTSTGSVASSAGSLQTIEVPGQEMGHNEGEHQPVEAGVQDSSRTVQPVQSLTPGQPAASQTGNSSGSSNGDFYLKILIGLAMIGVLFFIVYSVKKKQVPGAGEEKSSGGEDID